MVIGVHHIQISVAPERVAASLDFYVQILGFEQIEDPFASNGGFWLRGGEAEIHVRPEPNVLREHTRAHPAFLVDDLARIRSLLVGRGVVIEEQPDIPGLQRFHTFDPSGNRLELLQSIEAPAKGAAF